MLKIIITCVIAAAAGLVAGVAAMHTHLNPRVIAALQERDALQQELAALRETVDPQAAKLARLERDYTLQQEQIAALSKDLSSAQTARQAAAKLEELPEATQEVEAEAAAINAALDPQQQEQARDRGDRRGNRAPWDDENLTPEERDKRRAEFTARFQEGMDEFWNEQLAQTTDPAAQERIMALADSSQQLMELRRQMRDTELPEEQEKIEQQMEVLREETRALTQEHQDSVLQDIAAQNGVTKPAQQRAMAQAMREALQNPLFMQGRGGGPGGWGGGGRGGGRGGFGGGGGGGQAPPQ